jgi:AcrR family transcriptional regulator
MSTFFCHHFYVSSPAAPGTRKYHHGNLREALLETALQLIAEKGVAALTLREIGARASVSRMAAYRHFTNKDDLLLAVSEAGFTRFATELEDARNAAGPRFADRLAAMGEAYVRFAHRHRAHYEVMFVSPDAPGEPVPRAGKAAARAFDMLKETVREAQTAGEVRSGDPVAIAGVIWSMVHGISMLRLAHEDQPNDVVRLSAQVLTQGLRPSTEGEITKNLQTITQLA